MKNKIKVGFDLDGVILYNPARFARPLISGFKNALKKKDKTKFYIPKKGLEQLLWRVFHWSSIFVAPGYEKIRMLVKEGKIEAHLITGRYAFLKSDLDWWLKRIGADKVFESITYNEHNEQPHLYKERVITLKNLDYFIEDNFDIVTHLNSKLKKTNVWWIYNIIDRKLVYQNKFPTLKEVVEKLSKK